jgi:arylsulfatase A-like enzyme
MVAADAAMNWIAEQTDTPFLAVVWFGSPHSPHRAIEQDRKLYDEQPKNMQHFLGEITGMDRAFGKIRDGLADLGIRDNTILWYCSDNGALPKVGSSGGLRGNKGQVYEGGLMVPAILEWPAKLPKHRVTEMRCNTCDIYPTVLDIVGVTVPHQPPLDGVSLLPLIEGKSETRRQAMGFWDTNAKGIGTPSAAWMGELLTAQRAGKDLAPHQSSQKADQLPDPKYPIDEFEGHSALIDGDWKLHRIEGKDNQVNWELYNLKLDPAETKDRFDEQAQRAEQLKPKLLKWLQSVTQSLNGEDY